MSASSRVYTFLRSLWSGSPLNEHPVVDAVGTFPPKGSVVAINGCPQAATLSFNHTGCSEQKHYGTKYISGDSVVLGLVGSSGCPYVAASASRELMGRARNMLQDDPYSRISGSIMDTLHDTGDGEAISGGASASLLVVNRQELQLASTPCGSSTIIVKSCKTDEVFTVGPELGDGASLSTQPFPLGSGAAVKALVQWHRLKEDWEWVLMGSLAFWSLMTAAEAAKIVSSQARRGATPARILRALAYEAALRDPSGTTAQHIALSIARLDPAPEPSFATSPRIGTGRRITAPGEDARGIWQMAPTRLEPSPAGSTPPAASTPEPDANSAAEDNVPHGDAVRSSSEALQCMSSEDSSDVAVSGELTAQAVCMPGMRVTEDSEASGTDEKAHAVIGDATGEDRCLGEAGARSKGADACVFIQRVPSMDDAGPAGGLATAALLHDFVQREPRRTTVDTACSREFGTGKWWKVDVAMDVDVPEDDGFRVAGGCGGGVRAAEGGNIAGKCGGAGAQRPRRRGLRRAARWAVAGVAVVATVLMLRRRGSRK